MDELQKAEQIGVHKGALATLAKEREELAKMIGVVEQIIQMHVEALKELGVDLEAQAKEMADKMQKEEAKPQNSGSLEDQL